MPTEKENTPSKDKTRWERIGIDLISELLAVSIRCKNENTIAMYGLSKIIYNQIFVYYSFKYSEIFCNINFSLYLTMANGIWTNLLPSEPTWCSMRKECQPDKLHDQATPIEDTTIQRLIESKQFSLSVLLFIICSVNLCQILLLNGYDSTKSHLWLTLPVSVAQSKAQKNIGSFTIWNDTNKVRRFEQRLLVINDVTSWVRCSKCCRLIWCWK